MGMGEGFSEYLRLRNGDNKVMLRACVYVCDNVYQV